MANNDDDHIYVYPSIESLDVAYTDYRNSEQYKNLSGDSVEELQHRYERDCRYITDGYFMDSGKQLLFDHLISNRVLDQKDYMTHFPTSTRGKSKGNKKASVKTRWVSLTLDQKAHICRTWNSPSYGDQLFSLDLIVQKAVMTYRDNPDKLSDHESAFLVTYENIKAWTEEGSDSDSVDGGGNFQFPAKGTVVVQASVPVVDGEGDSVVIEAASEISPTVDIAVTKNVPPLARNVSQTITKKKVGEPLKKADTQLTAVAKKWQSVLSFIVVCSVYESGKAMTSDKQHEACIISYQAMLPDFLHKKGKIWSNVTEYNLKDFNLQQMMLSSGTKILNGEKILLKGKEVRKAVVKWLANMKDKDAVNFKKAFSFDILNRATSEAEECTGTVTGAHDITWILPSGTSAEDACNFLMLTIYNFEQESIVQIDQECKSEDFRITEIEELPTKYLPSIEYILIKYFVILSKTFGFDQNNFLCISLSDCFPGAKSTVTKGDAILGGAGKKSRRQIKQDTMQKKENVRVENANLRGEENDSKAILSQATMEFHLLSNSLGQQITLLNMSKDLHTDEGELEEWKNNLRDLIKQSKEIKDKYENIVEKERLRKIARESMANESVHHTAKKSKHDNSNKLFSPVTTSAFSRGVIMSTTNATMDNDSASNSSEEDDKYLY